MMKRILLVLALAISPIYAIGATSWFSCEDQPSGKLERHVCTSSDTLKLNEKMYALLGEIEGETASVNGETGVRTNPIGRSQITWYKAVLSRCASHECVVEAYHARIGFLERQARRLERGQGPEGIDR